MKKITLAIVIVFALLVVCGIVSIFTTTIGNYQFTDGHTVVINDKILSESAFADYIDSIDEYLAAQKIVPVNGRYVKNAFDEKEGYVYNFYKLSDANKTALCAKLDEQTAISYTVAEIDTKPAGKIAIFAAIGFGVLLVLQFAYFVIFERKIGNVRSALIATLLTFCSVIVTVAVAFILALIGIKFSIGSIIAALIVAFVSVVCNVIALCSVSRNIVLCKGDVAAAFDKTGAMLSRTLIVLFAPAMITCVVLAAVFSALLLPIAVPLLVGLIAVLLGGLYLALPLLQTNK